MQANYLLEEGQKKEKAVVMAGCVSQAAPNETWLKGISIVGVKQIDRVVEVVEETLKGNMGEKFISSKIINLGKHLQYSHRLHGQFYRRRIPSLSNPIRLAH